MEPLIEALKIIIAKAPNAHVADYAMRAISSAQNGSPLVAVRYQQVFQMALANGAAFSPDEMSTLAAAITGGAADRRDKTLQVRLTGAEYLALEEAATAEGITISEYARQKLLG